MSELPVMPPQAALIGGAWVTIHSTLDVQAPSYGNTISQIARCQAQEIDLAIEAGRCAFSGHLGDLSRWTARRRGEWLLSFAAAIEADHGRLSALECVDTGMPMTQAHGDITACACYFRFYGGAADKLHGETIPFENDVAVMTLREPFSGVGRSGHGREKGF